MKREILFKAICIETGKWVYGNLCVLTEDIRGFNWVNAGTYISNSVGMPWEYKVHPETVCQFTGLLDKNGNKIFEGDNASDGGFVYVVEWNQQNAGFYLKPIENIQTKELDIIDHIMYQELGNGYLKRTDLEITGNIHDK